MSLRRRLSNGDGVLEVPKISLEWLIPLWDSLEHAYHSFISPVYHLYSPFLLLYLHMHPQKCQIKLSLYPMTRQTLSYSIDCAGRLEGIWHKIIISGDDFGLSRA